MGFVAKEHVVARDHGLVAQFSSNDSLLAPRRVATYFSISRSYANWITAQIVLCFLLLALLFECVFLSQHFIDIFRDHADDVRSLTDAMMLVLLAAPEVHFVLPVATLTAVYLVVLRSRELRELIILAGTGFGARQFTALAFAWGAAALSVSLVITGIILPHTEFAFRSDIFAFRNGAIRAGGATGHFYVFPDYTVFKWPQTETKDSALFIYQIRQDGIDRAISVSNAHVTGSLRYEALDLHFSDVVAIDVPSTNEYRPPGLTKAGDCPDCARSDKRVMRAENYALTFDLGQLSHLEPRGIEPDEWTTAELLGISSAPSGRISDESIRKELIGRLVRALLCLTAPFIALLAVGWTTRLMQGFALPIACGVVLCIDVIGLTAVRMLDGVALWMAMAAVTMMFACILLFAIWQINAGQSALVKPALSKA
jgi:lipopolysaccharide export system permease protein